MMNKKTLIIALCFALHASVGAYGQKLQPINVKGKVLRRARTLRHWMTPQRAALILSSLAAAGAVGAAGYGYYKGQKGQALPWAARSAYTKYIDPYALGAYLHEYNHPEEWKTFTEKRKPVKERFLRTAAFKGRHEMGKTRYELGWNARRDKSRFNPRLTPTGFDPHSDVPAYVQGFKGYEQALRGTWWHPTGRVKTFDVTDPFAKPTEEKIKQAGQIKADIIKAGEDALEMVAASQ